LSGNVNWEVSFWGKYRRANEAAQAELIASEYGLQAIQVSLVTEVANTYFLLLDYKRRLQISERTLVTRKESSRIIGERYNKGIVPEIDLDQALIQENTAAASIPVYHRLIAYTENALSILIGENPREIVVSADIRDAMPPDSIPIGLPSQLLMRRPDVLEAEQMVVAQNARIGVAQALRFPSISLTAMFGMASPDLSAFNSGDALIGAVGAGLFGPIFQFGKNKRRVDIERERTEQMKLAYEKAVISAFRETEDALINIRTLEQELVFVENQVKSSTNAAKLSRARYDGGVTSYLEVLEAERTLFDIELYYTELLQRRLTAYTDLYKTLGGGWVQ
jgi:multidrug efflux system outer membrane protein